MKNSEIKIDVNDAITLCYIIDEFEEFAKNLSNYATGFNADDKMQDLYIYIIDGDKKENTVKEDTETFYINNKNVLTKINENTRISNFLLLYFNCVTGKFDEYIMQLFAYLKQNKNYLQQILANLNKLKELGFNKFKEIKLDNTKSFDGLYICNKKFGGSIEYLDGDVEFVPSYDDLKYKVINANYKIKVDIKDNTPKIILNNLIFETSSLPQKIDFDSLYNDLLNKKNNDAKIVNNSLKTSYDVNEISAFINNIEKSIGIIKDIKDKESASAYISEIKNNIVELECFLQECERNVLNDNLMTQDELKKDK